MTTRAELLQKHDNDYGFNPLTALRVSSHIRNYPSISVVIPYYETGSVFERVLEFLARAIDPYKGEVEVIVVDDGSVDKPLSGYAGSESRKWLRPIILPENRGRTEARNAGVAAAHGDIILFLDSDILVDDQIIINHARLHLAALAHDRKAICVSFFEFTNKSDERVSAKYPMELSLKLNDFRIECTYGPTWIGCEEDKQYIGQHMKLVEDTNYFRDWREQYKAWMLPNMILGGAFSVWRSEILSVGGFDVRFKGYGFTETSAVTRLVAERGNVVIPCTQGGGLHIDDEDINISRDEKDKIFKEKHAFYFDVFLKEEI